MRILAVSSLFLALACGGTTQSSASSATDGGDPEPDAGLPFVAGEIRGVPFVVRDVGATPFEGTTQTYSSLIVTLSDHAGACDEVVLGNPPSSRVLRIYAYNAIDTTPIGEGTYSTLLPDAGGPQGKKFSMFVFHEFYENCADGDDYGVASLTLLEVSSTSVTGSFDSAFEQGHLSGKFVAPICGKHPDAGTIPGNCK
jgi:hypothetical protein